MQFVRKSISAIGRVAIKLERAADRCIQVLHELIRTKIDYVVQEAIIVLKDIFRKYPNRYEGIIKDLCENLKALDNAESRGAMIWIIGQYCELIDNSITLMTDFAENFKDEAKNVQLAILNASVKMYLKLEGDAEELVTNVLQQATDESDNPDLRNRGYIYWRMLSENPEEAKKIILCEKPTINEDQGHIEPSLLDKLIDNISMLSSVYYKTPDVFVKKIRDRINERLDLEQEDLDYDHAKQEDYVDSMGVKKSDYIKESQEQIANYADLVQADTQEETGVNLEDLLGGGSSNAPQPSQGGGGGTDLIGSLLDVGAGGASYGGQEEEFDPNYNFTPVPYKPCLQANQPGSQHGVTGFAIEGAFRRSSRNNYHLHLNIQNNTGQNLSEFFLKINYNLLGVQVVDQFPSSFYVANQTNIEAKIKCSILQGNVNAQEPTGNVVVVQAGLKTSADLFYFQFPVLQHTVFEEMDANALNKHELQGLWSEHEDNRYTTQLQQLSPQVSNPKSLVQRFQENHLYLLVQAP